MRDAAVEWTAIRNRKGPGNSASNWRAARSAGVPGNGDPQALPALHGVRCPSVARTSRFQKRYGRRQDVAANDLPGFGLVGTCRFQRTRSRETGQAVVSQRGLPAHRGLWGNPVPPCKSSPCTWLARVRGNSRAGCQDGETRGTAAPGSMPHASGERLHGRSANGAKMVPKAFCDHINWMSPETSGEPLEGRIRTPTPVGTGYRADVSDRQVR